MKTCCGEKQMNNILVTGAGPNSFLGKHVVDELKKTNYKVITFSKLQYDLTEKSSVYCLFDKERPDIVINLSAYCGGIKKNMLYPADMIHTNLKMHCNLYDAIYKFDTKYVYNVGTVCMYPMHCPVPFKEKDLLNGEPELTNKPYGDSKRALLTLHQAYRKQHNIKGVFFVPVNMYGPYDHFDLENSHVIPALINKFCSAVKENKPTVECWGTGEATREFLYAGDAAAAIVKTISAGLDYSEPINLGTGCDISIKSLAQLIAELTNYKGKIVFTGEVSDGQPKRRLDVSRAEALLGWKAETSFTDGLIKTIQWYESKVNNEK
jgi:GDP-L-fucose synthase